MKRSLLSLVSFLTAAACAIAHPVPKDNHDRTIVVFLTPTAVSIAYRLELDDLTALNDLPRAEWAALTDRRQIYPVFLRYFAPVLADNLVASLDGKPLTFTCVAKDFVYLDHLRCDYRFEAKWQPEPGREHVFRLREGNFDMDSTSRLLLSLAGVGAVDVRRATAPSAALQAMAPADRGPGDGETLRMASAVFVVEPEPSLAAFKAGLPPDIGPERAGPEEGQIVGNSKPPDLGAAGTARAGPADGVSAAKSGPRLRFEMNEPKRPDFAEIPPSPAPAKQDNRLLDTFLTSRSGLTMALLLASFFFGAAHALAPGHGKTLVAAYLVGQRGTVWHAFLLGVVTTITHTAAVFVLAVAFWLYFGNRVPPGIDRIIGLVGGFMVAGLGLWLLMRRLSGQADHVHLVGGHSHGSHSHGGRSHSHGFGDHDHAGQAVGLRALVWLGIAGGILPCWDAIAVLIYALQEGKLWMGPILILAFSAGLASVLIGIGIGVVYTRRQIDARSNQSERLRKVVRVLPLFSAVMVTVLGLWMCYSSVR